MVVNGEVNHAAAKLEQRLARIAVAFCIAQTASSTVCFVRLFFSSNVDHRQPVDEGAQVQRPLVLPAEVQLPRDAEAVLRMAFHRLGVLRRGLAIE
jgi:hypothetical protein